MNKSNNHYPNNKDDLLNNETESLNNHSKQELRKLARNLSEGKYKNDSHQRDKLMQLLVKQLSSLEP